MLQYYSSISHEVNSVEPSPPPNTHAMPIQQWFFSAAPSGHRCRDNSPDKFSARLARLPEETKKRKKLKISPPPPANNSPEPTLHVIWSPLSLYLADLTGTVRRTKRRERATALQLCGKGNALWPSRRLCPSRGTRQIVRDRIYYNTHGTRFFLPFSPSSPSSSSLECD